MRARSAIVKPNRRARGVLRLAGAASALLLLLLALGACVDCLQDERPAQSSDGRAKFSTSSGDSSRTATTPHNNKSCQYEKGAWQECARDGSQLRVQQLKKSSDASCAPSKTIRRDCKPVGCKYARGQWSSTCDNGQRVRVDRLVATLDETGQTVGANCKPLRKVTKDCQRTCHYLKSAWSGCSNGLQTRNLTLAESGANNNKIDDSGGAANDVDDDLDGLGKRQQASVTEPQKGAEGDGPKVTPGRRLVSSVAPLGQSCAKVRQVKRECRTILSQTTNMTGANSTTMAQKRRSKQLQRQQRQKQKLPSNSSPDSKTTTKSPPSNTAANKRN